MALPIGERLFFEVKVIAQSVESHSCFCTGKGTDGLCACQRRYKSFESLTPPHVYASGWVCPKCAAVYAPTMTECFRCCPPVVAMSVSHTATA